MSLILLPLNTAKDAVLVEQKFGVSFAVDDGGGSLTVDGEVSVVNLDKTAFGELSVSNLTPEVQMQFPYGINTDIVKVKDNNGTTSVLNNMVNLSTGAQANATAEVNSIVPLKYHPGQGALARFTALFTAGVANSTQLAGIGSPGDGLFFGYNGTSFGVLRKQGGAQEVRTLTITTASSTAENITITLDGDADAAVTVTASGDISTTANEIALHDYSDLGLGWEAHSPGDGTVVFRSFRALIQTGTYSLSSATTAVGSVAQTLAGVVPTDTWGPKASWSDDQADGTGDLPVLDSTKGNVFQIRYQWLGYGLISFYIESPEDGGFHLVHKIAYANANSIPSLDNPTLPLCLLAQNSSNTTDIVVKASSMGAFTEGETNGGHVHHGVDVEYSGVGTTETPILTIHNKQIYQGKENRVRIKVILITASVEGTKPSTIRIKENGTLIGASYTDVDATNSVVNYDTSATSIAGGDGQFTFGMAKSDSDKLELDTATFFIDPGNFITVTGEASNGTIEGIISINWEELF